MFHKLIRRWWLLALAGVLYGWYAAMNFFMRTADGSLAVRTFVSHRDTIVNMGMLAIAAGACTIAASMAGFRKGRSLLLMLNGVACGALGVIFAFLNDRPIAFRVIALLIAAMAITIGAYEWATARLLRDRFADEWLLRAASFASLGFALAFLAFAFRWIRLNPASPAEGLYWMGSYFGFTAVCMVGLALRPKLDGWRGVQ